MNENQKSLATAALVILVMAAVVVTLTTGRRPRQAPADPHLNKAVQAALQQVNAPIAVQPVAAGARRRLVFAATFQRRMRARGQTLQAQVTGDGGQTLRLIWDGPHREHMDRLKRADPLLEELRGLGFKKIEMELNGQKVWSKEL